MTTEYARSASTDRGYAKREDSAQRVAGELLLRCGITPHLCGFDPLCGAIRMTSERDRTRALPAMNAMRTAVGALCKERNPEHAARDAILAGFLTTDETHTQIFPFSDRPSIADFICTLAELARDRVLP